MRRILGLLASLVAALAVSQSGANPLCNAELTLQGSCFANKPLDRMTPVFNAMSGLIEWGYATPQPACGDGIINGTDQCDGAVLPPSDASCVGCTPDCTCIRQAVCGNGIVEAGEACDPPNAQGTVAGCTGTDRCNATCTACVAQTAPICGDGSVNTPEACDPPFEAGGCGGGQICNATCSACTNVGNGVVDGGEECDPGDRYSATSDGNPAEAGTACPGLCLPDGTCPDPVCGNGVWEAGEPCDASDDRSPFQDACTPACVVQASCGNGIIETGTAGGAATDENCERPASTGGGANFGNAARWIPAGCNPTSNGCAILRDGRGNVTEYDFAGATAMTLMVRFRLVAPGTASQRLFYNGGNNDTTIGYLLEIGTSSRLSASFSPDATANSNLLTINGTTTLQAGVLYTGFVRKATNGTSVDLWLADGVTRVVSQQASGTIATTLGNSSQAAILGGTSTSSGPFQGDFMEEVAIWTRQLSESEMNARVATQISPSDSGLVLLLNFDGATTGEQLTDKSSGGESWNMLQGTNGGIVELAASPWSSSENQGVPDNCGTECGCSAGQVCNQSSCRCVTPPGQGGAGSARTFYVDAATGANTNYPCSSPSAPCRDVEYVLNPARGLPGDDVVVIDNPDSAPQIPFQLFCGSSNPAIGSCDGVGANAVCGTEQSPITIRCQNERQCAWITDGTEPAIQLTGCRWYRLIGLAARGGRTTSDNGDHTIELTWSADLYLEAMLCDQSNWCSNVHVYGIENSRRITIVESECLRNNRHCFRRHKTEDVRIARSYAHNHGVNQAPQGPCTPQNGGTTQRGGPDHGQFSNYPANTSLDENDIAEGSQGWGWQLNGGQGLGGIRGTSNNRILGSIAAGTYMGAKNYSRPGDCRGNADNVFRDFLVLNPLSSFGIRDSVTVRSIYDNITVIGGAASGFRADDPSPGTCQSPGDASQLSCQAVESTGEAVSLTLTDSVFTGTVGTDVNVLQCASVTRDCTVNDLHADSSSVSICTATNVDAIIPSILGTSGADRCVVYTGTADGADVRCRYENGVRLSGTANGVFWAPGDTTLNGMVAIATTAGCNAAPAPGPVHGCVGGFKFCRAHRAGWNDGPERCQNFALRWLNHIPEMTGCGASATSFLCP